MSNDSSLGMSGNFSFDLDSQKGVTQLLVSVRASKLSPTQKNELRDLVFQYINGGKDQSVRNSLEQKLNKYGIAPIAIAGSLDKEKSTTKKSVIGASRPAPSFSLSPVTPNTIVNETKVVEPEIAPKVVEAVVTPSPIPEAVVPIPEVIIQTQPIPEPVIVKEIEVPNVNVPDVEDGLRRIREIKSIINEKIGNPVNLVDINNDVGREYMSAMLDAMKKLNTGSSAVSAMKRLEAAYELVEKTIANYNEGEGQLSSPVDETKKPEIIVPPTVIPEMQKPVVPEPELVPVPEPKVVPIPDTVPEPEPVPQPPAPEPVPVPEPEPEKIPTPEPEEVLPPTPPTPVKPEPEVTVTESIVEPVHVPVAEPVSEWVSNIDVEAEATIKASSLAQNKIKLRTPDELPLASSLETSSVDGDPLFTDEVDEGLQQLLLEWPIFKKSGLFGTGAKGAEHPLFKKISTVQIPLLLAGRFEGATQEIKQSITDYMNGWRYEQGLIYKQGETFEHYLRRVIRHIIDLQRKKRPLS